jgi:hypothetical protein
MNWFEVDSRLHASAVSRIRGKRGRVHGHQQLPDFNPVLERLALFMIAGMNK